MSTRLIRILAFVALIGIVFAASCATFAQVDRETIEREGTAQ